MHAHLGPVESFDFDFAADSDRRDQVADLEPDISHDETKHGDHVAASSNWAMS